MAGLLLLSGSELRSIPGLHLRHSLLLQHLLLTLLHLLLRKLANVGALTIHSKNLLKLSIRIMCLAHVRSHDTGALIW